MSRNLKRIYGQQALNKISKARLFIVGVGGIGCELLKTLAKSGFRRFTILDLDIIEETNLNRQFFFRKTDVNKHKSVVGRQRLLQIDPDLEIEALTDNIYDKKFDIAFFSQFDVIVSALDNVKARSHLGMMAAKVKIPMIDAGTEGFGGQTQSFVVGRQIACYNCKTMGAAQQSFAVCTIRNQPQNPMHCIVYAKNFYDCFFGSDKTNSLKGDINLQQFVKGNLSDEQIMKAAINVFDALFYHRIQTKLDTDLLMNRKLKAIFPLKYEDALKLTDKVTNPPTTFSAIEDAKQKKSIYPEQKLWSIKDYAQKFVSCMFNILKNKKEQLGCLSFQKDDDDCMNIVYCLATLRTYNFMNKDSKQNKHKYMTFYQCKDKAGRIIPAIASTNSIAAATEVQELVKVVTGNPDLSFITYNNNATQKVSKHELMEKNVECMHCSLRSYTLQLKCDFSRVTYQQLTDLLKEYLSYGRQLFSRKTSDGAVVTILDNTEDTLVNLTKTLSQIPDIISQANTLSFEFTPNDHTEIYLYVFIKHEAVEGIQVASAIDKTKIKKDLLTYKRLIYNKTMESKRSVLVRYGIM